MRAYTVVCYLYRSNPIILRELQIPETGTVGDLFAACRLSMGIRSEEGEVYLEKVQPRLAGRKAGEVLNRVGSPNEAGKVPNRVGTPNEAGESPNRVGTPNEAGELTVETDATDTGNDAADDSATQGRLSQLLSGMPEDGPLPHDRRLADLLMPGGISRSRGRKSAEEEGLGAGEGQPTVETDAADTGNDDAVVAADRADAAADDPGNAVAAADDPGNDADDTAALGQLSQLLSGMPKDGPLATGRIIIYQPKTDRNPLSALTLIFDICRMWTSDKPWPQILRGAGLMVPAGVYRVGTVNEVTSILEHQVSYVLPAAGTFYRGQQAFDRKKVQSLLTAHFAPDQAAVLKAELAVPLTTVLETLNREELLAMVEQRRLYVRDKTKSGLILALSMEIREEAAEDIFEEMDIHEYLNFRKLVTTGECGCTDREALRQQFPVLCSEGRLGITRKKGFFLAEDVLRYYEEWFDEPEEESYREQKMLAQALRVCSSLYGVFSRQHLQDVLETIYPGEVSRETVDRVWSRDDYQDGELALTISRAGTSPHRMACEQGLFPRGEERIWMQVLAEDDSPRYIPDREEALSLGRYGIIFREPAGSGRESSGRILGDVRAYSDLYRIIYQYINQYSLAGHYCRETVNALRRGGTAGAVTEFAVQEYYKSWYKTVEHARDQLEQVLTPLEDRIPNILLYGYSGEKAAKAGVTSRCREPLTKQIQAYRAARKIREAEERRRRNQTGLKGRKGGW